MGLSIWGARESCGRDHVGGGGIGSMRKALWAFVCSPEKCPPSSLTPQSALMQALQGL